MMHADRIGDAELDAYVDGQLDAAGRLDVEAHLARNPELAARVMADLSTRDALRLAFVGLDDPVPQDTLLAAQRLERALKARRFLAPMRQIAAAVAIFALGWSAHFGWSEFYRAPNQAEILARAAALGEAANVRLPRLPDGWKVIAAAPATTDEGSGVRLTFSTPEFGRLSLVARNTHDVNFVFPTVHTVKNTSTVHWQMISNSYDLTTKLGAKPSEYAALELYQTLY